MKVAHDAERVPEAMESARRESKAFFGRDEIYLERYLTWPRHIEVQVVGDTHGNVVWVSTRDCSAQRRHQKLIEEAPAPGLPDGVEEAMGAAAVKAAKAVGYYNAGTVEFIFQDNDFFFLEMNTRLQVEHPVTEVITGIDLVEWQIRVDSGEKLPLTQKEVLALRRGHGIEIRINAENPTGGKFLPSPGTISKLSTPNGFGVRFDSGYESGDTVSQYYDNVGKLIVWGQDREVAIARSIRASAKWSWKVFTPRSRQISPSCVILIAVKHSTKWVEESLDLSRLVSTTGATQKNDARTNEERLVERRTTVEVNGKRFDVKMWVPEIANGGLGKAKKSSRTGGSAGSASGSGDVVAPMQGTIIKVIATVGQSVKVGDAVVVLEAMKMENQITAEKDGTVSKIHVKAGDIVGAGDVLVIIG